MDDKKAHDLLVELCWSLRHKVFSEKMAHTAKTLFADDHDTVAAYLDHKQFCKEAHRLAVARCFEHVNLPEP